MAANRIGWYQNYWRLILLKILHHWYTIGLKSASYGDKIQSILTSEDNFGTIVRGANRSQLELYGGDLSIYFVDALIHNSEEPLHKPFFISTTTGASIVDDGILYSKFGLFLNTELIKTVKSDKSDICSFITAKEMWEEFRRFSFDKESLTN